MQPPFPGMDPYLEGSEWPDVHQGLAYLFKVQLSPRVAPKYVVRVEISTVEDESPEDEIGIMYPDVEVLRKKDDDPTMVREPEVDYTPVTLRIPTLKPVTVRVPSVVIRDRNNNQLITAIEILSPVNKRAPGLQAYREKRDRLHNAGVHLLEIDLLRRYQRPYQHPSIPSSPYLITLLRGGSKATDVWAVQLSDGLPIVPVPLKAPDADVRLDIGKALRDLYEQSLYHLSVNYDQPPPPPKFVAADEQWIKEQVQNWRAIG